MAKENFSRVAKSLSEKLYNRAQERMIEGLPAAARVLHEYAVDALAEAGKSSMTGNTENGYGIAIYRNGRCVAVATTNDVTGKDPIQMTLAVGDKFYHKKRRYDGAVQEHTFTAGSGKSRIFADVNVVRWLNRNAPKVNTSKDSLAYRVVCIVDYASVVGGNVALLRFADSCESRGGRVREFRLG